MALRSASNPEREHEAVAQAVAVVQQRTVGDHRLLAYIVADEAPEQNRLKDLLRSRLPSYMVPSHILSVEAIPLTPNGKVDMVILAISYDDPDDVER